MGQKANPNSLRVGKQKLWGTSFSEKKASDVGVITRIFEQETLNYLNKIFSNYGFQVQKYQVFYCDSSVTIFVSLVSNHRQLLGALHNKRTALKSRGGVFIKSNMTADSLTLRLKQQADVKTLKKIVAGVSERLGGLRVAMVLDYYNKSINISKEDKRTTAKNLLSLRRYKKEKFFIEGFNTCFALAHEKEQASTLAKLIMHCFKTTKRFKPFLKFLRKTLTLLIYNTEKNSTRGVKIKIKGRVNKAGRAKSIGLSVGRVPCHSTKVPLTYETLSGSNQNGSIGVKVWVVSS